VPQKFVFFSSHGGGDRVPGGRHVSAIAIPPVFATTNGPEVITVQPLPVRKRGIGPKLVG